MPKMTKRQMILLSRICIKLDKLQVELCEDTPYEIPTAKETRERILEVMDLLEKFDEK